jgi:two-component system LytT family sensor kinase
MTHWFIRYKIYHLPFWFAYHIAWWMVLVGSPSIVFGNLTGSPYAFKFLFYVIFQALGVYFNLYYLIPRFLEKGKYLLYGVLLLATILATASLIVPGYFLSAALSNQQMSFLYGPDADNFWHFFQVNTLPSSVASMTLAMSVKLAKSWLGAKKRARHLEMEKLETELKFLRSQFNPHFLFNTINSIFVLIHKNPDKASASLAKFSELLRYQLYECNERHIPLQQEIGYIENFIALEKLRQEPGMKINVHLPSNACSLYIAPFVLMPFIENAFKHVAKQKEEQGEINIHISIKQETLLLEVSNTTNEQQQLVEVIAYGGIGLVNVQRRLELIYPQQHELQIEDNGDEYKVRLGLQLSSIPNREPAIAL